jgi:anti-sigma-K factor RskA
LIPAYVVGGIDAQEKTQIEESLEHCPEVAGELREYLLLSEALLYEPAPVQPPAFLHDQIMRAINPPVTKPLSPTQPIQTPTATPRRFPASRIWASLAAAAVLLLVITNLYWLAQVNELRDLNQDVADLLNEERFVLASLGAGQSQRVNLLPTDGSSDIASATVLWSPLIERALLYTDQLPPLAPDRAYQLWTIGDQGPLSEGVFQIDEQGIGVLVFTPRQPLSNYDALAITSEPASGSPAPTTDPLAVGEV